MTNDIRLKCNYCKHLLFTGTRLFACQNPLRQGGSRRGLPKSFLNRFTQVYVDSLSETDLLLILASQFPEIPTDIREKMVEFNKQIVYETDNHKFGHKGSPWEFNLRDLTRWCQVIRHSMKNIDSDVFKPESTIHLIYGDRMRTSADKLRVREIFESVFGTEISGDCPVPYVTRDFVYMGDVKMNRESGDYNVNLSVLRQEKNCLLLRNQFHALRSLMYCVNLNWMAILVSEINIQLIINIMKSSNILHHHLLFNFIYKQILYLDGTVQYCFYFSSGRIQCFGKKQCSSYTLSLDRL